MGTSLLSPDAWIRVMKKLDTEDIVRCRAVCRQFHDLSVENVLKSHTKLQICSVIRSYKDCFDLDHCVSPKNSIQSDSHLEMEDIKVISKLFPSVSVLKFNLYNNFLNPIKYDPLVTSLQLFPNIVCLTITAESCHGNIVRMEPSDKLIHLNVKRILGDDRGELKNVFPSLQSLELEELDQWDYIDNKFVFPICSPSKRVVLRGSRENSFHWSLFASSLEVIEAVIDFSDYSRKYQPSHPGLHSLSVDITTREEEQEESVNLTGLMNFILDNKQSLRNVSFSAVNASRDSFESLFASLSFISKLEITFDSDYIASSIGQQTEVVPSMKYLSLVYQDNGDSADFCNGIWPSLPSDLDNLSIQVKTPSRKCPGVSWSPYVKSMLQPQSGIKQVTLIGDHYAVDEWQRAFDKVDEEEEYLIYRKFVTRVRQNGIHKTKQDFVVTLANEP